MSDQRALLTELQRGIDLTLSNAQELCAEAELLRKNGALCRAYLLHQISLEECGKSEILGATAMSVFLGLGEFDEKKLAQSMRNHKAKNYANAYFATQSPEEAEAREQGDLHASVEAFRKFQKKFHDESNDAKNASLYVDFTDSRFVSPSDAITTEMVDGISVVNAYFLKITEPYGRMMQRVASDEGNLENTLLWVTDRMNGLKEAAPEKIEAEFSKIMDEMVNRYLSKPTSDEESA